MYYSEIGCPCVVSNCVYTEILSVVGSKVVISPKTKLDDDLGIDTAGGVSLDELIEDISTELSLSIPQGSQGVMSTVDDVVKYFWNLWWLKVKENPIP